MAFRQQSLQKISLFGFILFVICSKLTAQQTPSWQPHYWQSLEKYRAKVVAKTFEHDSLFKEVLYRWKSVEKDTDLFDSMLFNCSWAYKIYDNSIYEIKHNTRANYPNSKIRDIITESDLLVLAQHFELVNLINRGILESDYPYKVKRKYGFIRQLDFLDLKPGEIIADIGAGSGFFSQLMAFIGVPIKIYITENDPNIVSYLDEKVAQRSFAEIIPEIIKGTRFKTHLPEKVDKIILRNTFHHFSNEDVMLRSIRESLKPDGKLFVFENLYGTDSSDHCKMELTEPEIRNPIKQAGFHLIRRLLIDDFVLLEYSL